jgi:hypothetical protein
MQKSLTEESDHKEKDKPLLAGYSKRFFLFPRLNKASQQDLSSAGAGIGLVHCFPIPCLMGSR